MTHYLKIVTTHAIKFEYVCDPHIHTDDHIMVEYDFTVNCKSSDRLLEWDMEVTFPSEVGSSFSERLLNTKWLSLVWHALINYGQ